MALLLNLLVFIYLFTSSSASCSCSTPQTSRFTAKVDNARQTLLSGTLPDGVTLDENKDVYCTWQGYKNCCGAATEKCHIKANYVSEDFPHKNLHFKGDDDNAGYQIETCVAASTQSVTKTVSCFYVGSSTPISGLDSVQMNVKEPVSCSFETVTLSELEMDIASDNLNNRYINKQSSITVINH
uniref:DUF4773 domain-containing protein n=1 Tax=Amphimedon queenslandica TaxID=400682 RepID=A0A1X7VC20_AMPQE